MSFKINDLDRFLKEDYEDFDCEPSVDIDAEMSVATTIRDQIGHKALYMLGAQNIGGTENSLSFKIRGTNKVSHIKITLNSMDTYDVEFFKIRGSKISTVNKVDGIYADQLLEIIEQNTGLYTSL